MAAGFLVVVALVPLHVVLDVVVAAGPPSTVATPTS
jgi:hypothetical protein